MEVAYVRGVQCGGWSIVPGNAGAYVSLHELRDHLHSGGAFRLVYFPLSARLAGGFQNPEERCASTMWFTKRGSAAN